MKYDKRTRVGRIYEAGEKAYSDMSDQYANTGHSPPRDHHLLYSFAAMIAEATRKPGQKGTAPPKPKADLKFAQFFMDSMLMAAGDRINTEPFDRTWPAKIGAVLKRLDTVTIEDATNVGGFIKAKGWWQKRTPTMNQVIKYLPDLIAATRQSDAIDHDPRFA